MRPDRPSVFGTSHATGRLWAVGSDNLTLTRGTSEADAAPEFKLASEDERGRPPPTQAPTFLV